MALPDDVQIALTLLQVTGLVLPIVFIALRPFYAPGSKREVLREEQQTRQTGDVVEGGLLNLDLTPRSIRFGSWVVGFLAAAAFIAGLRIIRYAFGSWLVLVAAACLVAGIVSLAVLFRIIQGRFSPPESV
jgi:hypothetical protein